MIDDLKVVFNQHKMHITQDTQNFFIENGLVGVHYSGDVLPGKDECSSDPKYYSEKASYVLKRMRYYCETGALVVGYYNEHQPIRMIIGLLIPGSEINPVIRDIWISGQYPEGKTCYKTIQLENFFEIDLTENRQLESCIPRGNVFVNWKVNGIDRSIKYLYKLHNKLITPQDRTVYNLSYTQLEVLCSEYLRVTSENYRIDHLITPVGRSQKSTDIDGINKNGKVLAQVSYSNDEKEIIRKMSSLSQYIGPNTQLLYFGPRDKKYLAKENVTYLPIEGIFSEMKDTILLDYL
jgi:hypothetical protein